MNDLANIRALLELIGGIVIGWSVASIVIMWLIYLKIKRLLSLISKE